MNKKLKEIVDRLPINEKLKLLVGKNSWEIYGLKQEEIEDIFVADGPHGLRKKVHDTNSFEIGESVKATCFPPACTSACSFNEDLLFQMGKAMGEECRKEDVSVLLGPGVNIKRNSLCGRNFEYFSEDPYVSGKMGSALIRGVQSVGVGTSLKHFAANNQEYGRLVTDSIIDERALREIYLKAFEICVKEAKPWTIMAAYNLLNGEYCCGNKKLLKDILRTEWGFDGVVLSDWGAVDDPVFDLKAGLDIQMPGPAKGTYRILKKAYKEKLITKQEIDIAAYHVLSLSQNAKKAKNIPYICNMEKHLEIAQTIAEESMVLLKNEGILPLEKSVFREKRIALIGEFAKKSRYQGAGSSIINPYKLDSICEAFTLENIPYTYANGYSLNANLTKIEIENNIKKAIEVCKKSDIVLIIAGLPESYESEGFDRTNIEMPLEQNQLIQEICKIHKNVIIILQTGSVVSMPWLDKPQAVLLSYLGGCQGGKAITNILFGKVNPSGKLAETFVKKEDFLPNSKYYPGENKRAEYRESIFVGYRYFDYVKSAVEFPFGFGLSYTKYNYKMLKIEKNKEKLNISFEIKNIGKRDGKETTFLFVGKENTEIIRPKKELKGFKKVILNANESKIVQIELKFEDLAFYCVKENKMVVEPGEYTIYIASNAWDIELEGKIKVDNNNYIHNSNEISSSYQVVSNGFNQTDFNKLLAHTTKVNINKKYTLNSTVSDIKRTLIGKILRKTANHMIAKMSADEVEKKMMEGSLIHMPLRQLTMQGLSYGQVRFIIFLLNLSFRK